MTTTSAATSYLTDEAASLALQMYGFRAVPEPTADRVVVTLSRSTTTPR